MARVKYIGPQESTKDTVAGTGLVWLSGQTLDVPNPGAVARLLEHTDCWVINKDDQPEPEKKSFGVDPLATVSNDKVTVAEIDTRIDQLKMLREIVLKSELEAEARKAAADEEGDEKSHIEGIDLDDHDDIEEEDDRDPLPSLTRFNAQKLGVLAKTRFGHEFDVDMTVQEKREKIIMLERAGRTAG